MMINFNHVTNDISASSGSITVDGAAVGGSKLLRSARTSNTILVAAEVGL